MTNLLKLYLSAPTNEQTGFSKMQDVSDQLPAFTWKWQGFCYFDYFWVSFVSLLYTLLLKLCERFYWLEITVSCLRKVSVENVCWSWSHLGVVQFCY